MADSSSAPIGPAVDPGVPQVRTSWYRELPANSGRVLVLAGLGWLFEVYEIFILALTLPALIAYFSLTRADGGMIASISAVGLSLGGVGFGWIADRIGRVRTMVLCILIYSVFTAVTAFAPTVVWLDVLRFTAGLGMGGTWSAGAALVAETWGPAHRGKGGALMQMGLPFGSLLAIGVVLLTTHLTGDLNTGGWRWIYGVGILPILILYPIARRTPESPIWLARTHAKAERGNIRDLLQPRNAKGLFKAFMFIFFIQYVYWAVLTWTPTFLVTVKHFAFVRSLAFTLSQQMGSITGFILFAMLVDRIGRRPTFSIYLFIGIVSVAGFVTGEQQGWLLVWSYFTGVSICGIFAGLGPFAAELVPNTSARSFAMGIAYNGGRTGGLIAPYVVGAMATTARGFQFGMLTTILAFLLAWGVVLMSPETKGEKLA